jgi:glutaredoxin
VALYALSTCVWCKKTKRLLDELGVEYDYVFVDQLKGREEEEAMSEVARLNPSQSFPTLAVDGQTVIVGFKETKIRQALS